MIDIGSGEEDYVTQTIALRMAPTASITIVKDATPNDAQDFSFTTTGSGLSAFSLDDDADGTLSNTKVFTGLEAGTYSVAEGAVSGWEQTGAVCSDGSPVSAIVLSSGENVTCTFTNTKLGKITVIKDAVPDDAQDFSFTTSGSGLSAFSLDDDADGTLSNTKVFSNLAIGQYSVTEDATEGFDLTDLVCSDDNGLVSTSTATAILNIAAGEEVSCTFTNTKEPEPTTGSIQITKYLCPDGTSVVRSANGVGGTVPEGCTLQEGKTFGYVHGTQTDAAGPYPELSAPLTAGGATNGSGVLLIGDLPADGRYLIVETDENGAKLPNDQVLGLYCVGDGDTSNNNDNQELTFVPVGGTAQCVAYNEAPPAPSCNANATQVITSGTETQVDAHAAALVTFIHSAWMSPIAASWIWSEDPISDAVNTVTKVFSKQFTIVGTPSDSSLLISADNTFSVAVNGNTVCSDVTGTTFGSQVTCAIPAADLISGTNTITFTVTNLAMSGGTPFTNPAGLKYRLTVNNNECVTPPATTLKVHIYKYLKVGDTETQVPDDAGIASFPMTASWNAANIGSGSGSYVLGNGLGGAAFLYAADTSAMQAPADYSTSETTGGQVLPVGAECEAGKYRLVGYRWGSSLAAAESASLSTTAPSFTGIISDRHVIVVNEECDTPEVQNVTVHIYKYLSDGDTEALIPNDTLITYHFPMQSSWSAENIGSGSGSYWLGNDHGHPSEGLNYTASTSIMTAPADYATHEVTTSEDEDSLVLPSDALCQPGMYKLVGYRTGETLAEAEEADLTTEAPSFTDLTSDRYVIVVNEQCGDTPEVQTATVTMCKVDQDGHGQSGWHLTLKGQTVNDITLYANSMLGANTAALSAFQSYLATISGTWTNVGHNDADAEYTSTSTPVWDEHMQGYPGLGEDEMDVQLNEQFIDWGEYRSDHTYTYAFTPVIDGSANFRIFDGSGDVPNAGWYGDNDGSLSLNVAVGYTGTTTGEDGCVTFEDVPYGSYVISEENQPGWTNVLGLGGVAVDDPTESFTVVNEQDVVEPTTATLIIVKHAIGGNGEFDFTIEGWEESSDEASVATEDGYGTTTIELDSGYYDVTESVPEGWDLTDVSCSYDGESEGESLQNGEAIEVYAGDTVTCTFTNTKEGDDEDETPQENPQSSTPPSGGGGNNGPIFGSFGSFGGGSVLGASTTTLPNLPDSCTPLITGYLREGRRNNDPAQVRALQEFLNEQLGLHIPVTGHFGPLTTAAVKQFQLKHASEILTPWGLTDPTGFVYRTTQRWINLVHCSSLTIPMPTDLTPYTGE